MSYNVGVYTAPAGSESAFAGQVIASATWNAIFTDISTALNQIAYPSGLAVRIVVSLSNGNTDNPLTVPILSGFTRYRVTSLDISGASATLAAGSVGLYTGAGATGVTVIGSTTMAITTSLEGTSPNYQIITPSVSTITLNVSVLFLRVLASVSGVANMTAFIKTL